MALIKLDTIRNIRDISSRFIGQYTPAKIKSLLTTNNTTHQPRTVPKPLINKEQFMMWLTEIAFITPIIISLVGILPEIQKIERYSKAGTEISRYQKVEQLTATPKIATQSPEQKRQSEAEILNQYNPNMPLGEGARSLDVKAIQEILSHLGMKEMHGLTGEMGQSTINSLKKLSPALSEAAKARNLTLNNVINFAISTGQLTSKDQITEILSKAANEGIAIGINPHQPTDWYSGYKIDPKTGLTIIPIKNHDSFDGNESIKTTKTGIAHNIMQQVKKSLASADPRPKIKVQKDITVNARKLLTKTLAKK